MSSAAPHPFAHWLLALSDQITWRIHVESKVDSTQDAARRMRARIGDVVVADRQTHGRGRHGASWYDAAGEGVAMTLVIARDRPERQAILAAVALCEALEDLVGNVRIGIKWPNDLLANGRKLAGILIEQVDDQAFIGVGINVEQQQFPGALERTAVSLRQLGVNVDRVQVMLQVLAHFAPILRMQVSDEEAIRRFAEHDALVGKVAAFRSGDHESRGTVLRVDPMRGLAVQTSEGEVWLTAATTTALKD